MSNKRKKTVRRKETFFEKNKKRIIIFGAAVAVLLFTVIAVSVIKGGGGDNTGGTLDGDLNFSDDGLYDGYFEGDGTGVTVTCISGTPNCCSTDGGTVTFGALGEDSVYSVSGKLNGSIVIDVGDEYKLELEMHGLSLVSDTVNPITVKSARKVTLKAKNGYDNYIYDMRDEVDKSDGTQFSGAIYAVADLEISGKGALTVISKNNNGIHTKDDLTVKNLTLTVVCTDNALKGNDSVTLDTCNTNLIATQGDAVKTSNTDVSAKGKQRGTVTVNGGTHIIGAARDGIDAAYDLIINGDGTVITVYTDKYSSASEDVVATASGTYYLRSASSGYRYSVKYYNSEDDYLWVNVSDSYETGTAGASRPGGFGTEYRYYKFEKHTDYKKLSVYMYSASQAQGQDVDYYACSAGKAPNENYDTLAVSYGGGTLSVSWTNYTTSSAQGGFGGHGGFGGGGGIGGIQDGNTEKNDYSSKGLKAGNSVTVNGGEIKVKSYDDAIHAGCGAALENGSSPRGDVTVNGGSLTLYSNDDGIHADGTLTVTGGSITVEHSYEGLEGEEVVISGGDISVTASDDGINGTATFGTAVEISGGSVYIYCNGDGIDSNSRTSYGGIVFSGGSSVIISNSTMDSAIDTENGYSYSGGTVVAVMPRGGMSGEATHCRNFSSVGCASSMSLASGKTLTAKINGETVSVKVPCSMSAYVIVLGDKDASLTVG